MKLTTTKIILLFIVLNLHSDIYPQDIFLKSIIHDISISASMNYISSASIMLDPGSSDLIERSSAVNLKGGYGYGVTLKKRIIGDNIYLGISTEYIKIKDDQLTIILENDYNFVRARVTETVEMIPLELSVYFNIPRFVDNLNVYLGGGAGFYFGNRTRKMAGMETVTLSKSPLFSLNVLFGTEYFIGKNFSLNLEMKVRDGKYKVHSQFPVGSVTYENQTYYFDRDFQSKVFIDGLKISLGVGYNF
jgi:hypothetical protein